MDTMYDVKPGPRAMLERIDAVIRELQELRQIVLAQGEPSTENVTDELWGALASELQDEAYDLYLDWERFAL